MKKQMIFDAHCDTALLWYQKKFDFFNEKKGHQASFLKLKEGGVKIQVFALCLNSEHGEFDPLRTLLSNIIFIKNEAEKSGKLKIIENKNDLEAVKKNPNVIGGLIAIEGGDLLRGSLEIARIIFDLGVRVFTPTWNYRNCIGTGMYEAESDNGLTRFGKKLIPYLQDLGVIVDVSHSAEKTFRDILKYGTKPVIASHSNVRKICSHPRNLKDAQLEKIIGNKGVVGINFFPNFLNNTGKAKRTDIIRHIDYISGKFGDECIGFGSDFDGIHRTPDDLNGADQYPLLINDLEKNGYSKKQINKIAFENFYHFFKKHLPKK